VEVLEAGWKENVNTRGGWPCRYDLRLVFLGPFLAEDDNETVVT
jgi:hypothetical protein